MRIPGYSMKTLIGAIILYSITLVVIIQPSWFISGDGFGYYTYLRSAVFDGDLNFDNELSFLERQVGFPVKPGSETQTGRYGIPLAIGPALLWSPAVGIARLIETVSPSYDPYTLPGYNTPYMWAVAYSTMLYVWIGAGLLYVALRRLFPPSAAWWGVLAVVVVSPLPEYMVSEPAMSHGLTFFTVSLLVWVAVRAWTADRIRLRDAIALGLASGLAFLMRWQDALFLILPVVVIISKSKMWRERMAHIAILLGIFIIAALPQLFVWHHIYGEWILKPPNTPMIDLLHPHLISFLFSGHHGFLLTHPLLIIGILGIAFIPRQYRFIPLTLGAILILQIYLNSALSDWFGGASFGARRMISSLAILSLGFAAVWDRSGRRWMKTSLLLILCTGIIFNGLLIIAYNKGVIKLGDVTTACEVYSAPFRLLRGLN